MKKILKILTLPVLILLPWMLLKFTNLEGLFRNFIENQFFLIFLIILPGIIITLVWIFRMLMGQSSDNNVNSGKK